MDSKFPELGNCAAIPMNIWGAVFSNDPHFALSQRSHSQRVFLGDRSIRVRVKSSIAGPI